jgi:aminocarboxymuconate-semialdehyde decarboxylase
MTPAHECHRSVMIAGKLYRTVSDKAWTTARRLADLPSMGLSRQAISPMPELLSYWMEAADALQLLQYLNERIATMVDESRGALIGLGAVPLQDLDLAIRRAAPDHGAAGMRRRRDRQQRQRRAIGDPRSIPSSRPARRSAPRCSCTRSSRPAWIAWSGPRRCSRCWPIRPTSAWPARRSITGKLMQRRPRLRIAFSHGGGTLASLLPRLQQGWQLSRRWPTRSESHRRAGAAHVLRHPRLRRGDAAPPRDDASAPPA